MPRSLKAILVCVFLVSFLAILTVTAPVQADTTYLLSAHSQYWQFSDFSLQYVDSIHADGKFEIGEFPGATFSGMTWTYSNYGDPPLTDTYNLIVFVPVNSGTSPFTESIGGDNSWGFTQAGSPPGYHGVQDSIWTYSQEVVVPLPPSVFLLGAGLIGLALARRKKLWGK